MKAHALLATALCALALAPAARAAGPCLGDKPLHGVNIAGAEFNSARMPGTLFKDYTYPSDKDLRYFADQGANTVRLPFRWERVQRSLGGPLDEGELKVMRKVVDNARDAGLCVILDAHNFGTYAKQKLGSPELPIDRFTDFWLRMREAFPDPGNVAFGLMNEPAHAPRGGWARAAQEAVTALRGAGSEHLLLVSGAGWSGAHDWAVKWQGLSNADAFAGLHDPLGRSVIEVHQYADRDHSGTKADCMPPERMRALMTKVGDWAREHRQRVFLGEFGVAPTPECLDTLKAQLDAMRGPQWAGWTYWAAGGWWGPTYIFGVQPIPGQPDRPQLAVLREAWKQ
ncbi:MAG: glycoside hydrolase family 5 protein [Rhizobacter sp.]|nr:glycoside hydrolase family 5 protein [Rhizobacter sp.]